jgi:dTDP-4-amino-4,6-dideoxyglucose formyltransferase
MNILVICDNKPVLASFKAIVAQTEFAQHQFSYGTTLKEEADESSSFINVQKEYREKIIDRYALVLSLHCRQIFPAELVEATRCVNIHPGYMPFNRGWYPQVFCILNKQPAGATIHEMDERTDHGPAIARQEVPVMPWDTSLDVYKKIIAAEQQLLKDNLVGIINGNYQTTELPDPGKLNTISDFRALCKLNRDLVMNLGEAIDLLRALTHPPYNNAYFIDRQTNRKVFVEIKLKPADDE